MLCRLMQLHSPRGVLRRKISAPNLSLQSDLRPRVATRWALPYISSYVFIIYRILMNKHLYRTNQNLKSETLPLDRRLSPVTLQFKLSLCVYCSVISSLNCSWCVLCFRRSMNITQQRSHHSLESDAVSYTHLTLPTILRV